VAIDKDSDYSGPSGVWEAIDTVEYVKLYISAVDDFTDSSVILTSKVLFIFVYSSF
jgi:hypothetical protein